MRAKKPASRAARPVEAGRLEEREGRAAREAQVRHEAKQQRAHRQPRLIPGRLHPVRGTVSRVRQGVVRAGLEEAATGLSRLPSKSPRSKLQLKSCASGSLAFRWTSLKTSRRCMTTPASRSMP